VSRCRSLVVDCVHRTAPTVDGPTPYKMIRTTNVRNGRVDVDNVRYVTEETFATWNRRATPKPGDVLLTREAPVGEVGVLRSADQVFLGQRLMLYRPDPSRVTSEYLLAAFSSSLMRAQFDRNGSGSTVKHLPLPACQSFEVPLPPLHRQQEFARRVDLIRSEEGAARAHAAELDELAASLQARAFAG